MQFANVVKDDTLAAVKVKGARGGGGAPHLGFEPPTSNLSPLPESWAPQSGLSPPT